MIPILARATTEAELGGWWGAHARARPRRVVDVRWYLDGRSGRQAYVGGHLPGAVFADVDTDLSAVGRPAVEGRHPLPDPAAFAAAMSRLGIGDDSVVLAYDDSGGLTAGRLVVMLRWLGVDAALLDGGITTWAGRLETGDRAAPAVDPPATPFTPRPWPAERLATVDETVQAAAHGVAVLDARSAERHAGTVVSIDQRLGHIPGARSSASAELVGDDGALRPAADLAEHFAGRGVTAPADAHAAIAYCGSGVSACLQLIAMEHLGLPPARLFVASWSGYAADPDRPAELGA